MTASLRETVHKQQDALRTLYHAPLRAIARRAVRVWFNRERLDRVLLEAMGDVLQCDLLYAIDTTGQQVSSNVYEHCVDVTAYQQDLSVRPYVVTLPQLHHAAFQGAFLCDVYTSRVTRRPCVTLMCGVTSGPSTLGFIAGDLDPRHLLAPQTQRISSPLTVDLG